MSINAKDDYDRLKKMDRSSRDADASYKLFKAEYEESETKEEFHEKITNRLEIEGFNMSSSDARQYYRRFLSKEQLDAWATCMMAQGESGGLLLSANAITEDSFTLRVKWLLPKSVGAATLDINIEGGTIAQQGAISTRFTGNGAYEYIVSRSKNAKTVRVAGNMAGSADSVLALIPLAPIENPAKGQMKCIYKPLGVSVDFDGDGCHDEWSIGNGILVRMGNGRSFEILPSPDYKARNGVWVVGDFNGDGKSDLAQIVTSGVSHPDYAHIFCDIQNSNRYSLSDFNFRQEANPQHDYCVACGAWIVEDVNNDGVSDLKHSSNLHPFSLHKWVSVKTKQANGKDIQTCGKFKIQ